MAERMALTDAIFETGAFRLWSPKQITEIIHLWWGETNYHPEVPREGHPPQPPPGGYSDTPYFGCSTKNQVLRLALDF